MTRAALSALAHPTTTASQQKVGGSTFWDILTWRAPHRRKIPRVFHALKVRQARRLSAQPPNPASFRLQEGRRETFVLGRDMCGRYADMQRRSRSKARNARHASSRQDCGCQDSSLHCASTSKSTRNMGHIMLITIFFFFAEKKMKAALAAHHHQAAALRTNINIDGRPLPTQKRRRTSSKHCAPHVLHASAPHFHLPVN